MEENIIYYEHTDIHGDKLELSLNYFTIEESKGVDYPLCLHLVNNGDSIGIAIELSVAELQTFVNAANQAIKDLTDD